MNRRVSVWKYVRIGKKWRYCKPAVEKNGKIKSAWVIVKGKEEHHPEGNFYPGMKTTTGRVRLVSVPVFP
jgi:hypothetical protein